MSKFAPAAEASIKIITFLSERNKEIGISEISRGTEINKNMVFRILNSLEKEGWVYCNDQKYSLTLLPFKLASAPITRLTVNTAATPVLYNLLNKTRESVYLGVLHDDKVLYLQHLDGTKNVRVAGRIGGEYDLYCSAPGKVLLANADEAFINDYLSRRFEKKTENTIINRLELARELEVIRKNGYAVDREEFAKGIFCIAAPVFDHSNKVVGTIGCSTLTFNNNQKALEDILKPFVLTAAKEISAHLGGN